MSPSICSGNTFSKVVSLQEKGGNRRSSATERKTVKTMAGVALRQWEVLAYLC